ncbi:NADH-quinone oxidoreductase subunit NuoG [bacterium]|nr:NADH-quinone oxidoreductase subunit NuoG [bacterium]
MAKVTKGQAPGTGATVAYPEPAGKVREALKSASEEDILTLTLNGREVKAVKGETIIEVCHREDVYVPHYCWHPSLSIAGNCRLCLVHVEKVPKPVIACQTTVGPGMVVNTEGAEAKDARSWMMEFLLINHPLDCPICDRGGECQLQRYSVDYGIPHARMRDKKRKFVKPQADPLIDIERNRCIMCTRCVRFTEQVGGERTMGVFDRGDGNYIGTFGQGPVSNLFSGNVIDLCPVGCLTNRPFRFKARPWELRQTQSTCDQCSAGCKVTSWTRNDRLYRTTPPSRKRHTHFTINEDTEEFLCNQGRFGSDYGQHESRLDESTIRKADRLTPAAFDEAIEAAASGLKKAVDGASSDAVAMLLNPRLTIEEGYLARRLAGEVLHTPSIDWRLGRATAQIADAISQALDAADGDLEKDPDVIVVLNGEIYSQSPVLALRIQELGRRLGKKIVMLGHHHDHYIGKHADGQYHNLPGKTADALSDLAKLVGTTTPDAETLVHLAHKLNTTGDALKALMSVLKGAERGLLVHGLEDFGGLYAPQEVPAAIGLRKALGDKWSYLPVVTDRNAVGLHAVGAEPGAEGVAAADLIKAIEDGKIRSLLALGADGLAAVRDDARVLAALDKLDFFVLADHFQSPFAEKADVFLALATNLERTGVYADIEGNLAVLKQAVSKPSGDARGASEVLTALGRALGDATFGADTPEEAWQDVLAQLAPESKVTLKDLELEGGFNNAHYVNIRPQGGARNRSAEYNPGNYRTDGLHLRGSSSDVSTTAAGAVEELPAGDGPLLVWGGHVSGSNYITHRAEIFKILQPKPFLEVHPFDAEKLGVEHHQFAVLHVEGKKTKVGIKMNYAPAPGTVYLPAGAAGAIDPAEFAKPVRVKIEPLDERVPSQGEAFAEADATGDTR